MITAIQTFLEFLDSDIIVYIAVAFNTVFTLCKNRKTVTQTEKDERLVNKDIQSLYDYHQKMADELKKKIGE